MNRKQLKPILGILFLVLLLFISTGLQAQPTEKNGKSLAWQLDQFVNWLIETRDLVPRPEKKEKTFFVLNHLHLEGSVEKNSFNFTLTGAAVADKPVLIPLFGHPNRVMLKNVTINNKPAVVGFDKHQYYFVRTGAKQFTIKGQMALLHEWNFNVPGPVNLFTADITKGWVIEGSRLPGLKNTVIHLDMQRKKNQAQEKEEQMPPLFKVSRAIRIQKEITFEYEVHVRAGKEMASVSLPLPYGEQVMMCDVKGWKQEKGQVTVPASGRERRFTLMGRLPKIQTFKPDPRSNYEWWLVESDVEHRVEVKTKGKPMDPSESPVRPKVGAPKLFMLTGGQTIDIKVRELAAMDALAMVIDSQVRKLVWTKQGELVAEDTLQYRNNGIDYLTFDCKGKPLYFEEDKKSKKILAGNPAKETEVMVPLKKGKHQNRLQSITSEEPGVFAGILRLPVPAHDLTVSRVSLQLGLPDGIIPVWFSGDKKIQHPFKWKDLAFVFLALLSGLLLFKGWKARTAGIIALIGIYLLLPQLFYVLLVLGALGAVYRLVGLYFAGWKRWVVLGSGLLILLVGWAIFHAATLPKQSFGAEGAPVYGGVEGGVEGGVLGGVLGSDGASNGYSPARPGKATKRELWDKYLRSGRNAVRGVIPVALKMPGYNRHLALFRQMVTPDRPLTAKLVYVTTKALYPLLLTWLLCLIYAAVLLKPRLAELIEKMKPRSTD